MAYFEDTSYGADGVWISGSLTASRTDGGIFNWQNTEEGAVIVDAVLVDVTTAATSTVCTLDVGQTDTSAATSTDNMIDGADISTTARIYNSIKDAGTNGKGAVRVSAGKWITASEKTGDATGLAGKFYFHYRKVRT